MAVTNNTPVSEILKSKTSSEDEPKKKSREDWRKAKELEEARKAGTAPAAVDEEGRDINPHIPQYISAAPWYFGSQGPTLKHQRIQEESVKKPTPIDLWYKRGVNTEVKATKFRKGACENCGAMTHQRKDCMERPRKVGAKFTNTQIAPDEFVQPVIDADYDGKRDRWAGYDPSQHRLIVDQYHKIEEAKRQLRAEKLNAAGEGQGSELDDEEDEDKYVDEVDMPGTKVDSKQRITVRNLRIREDTAKYLRNLDPNSAYYDPKTRSMRDNPHENTVKPGEELAYAGENFVRFTGDTRKHAKAQLFAWEAYEKGVDVHLLAEPTKLELLQKDYEQKKDEFKHRVQQNILEEYGGEEHLQVPPKQLLLAQTEDYVEYSRYGKVIKGQEKSIARSKYEEDVFPNNHTSVWGSWWHNGAWGYKCCHSFIKGSYCTGEAGKVANVTVPLEVDRNPFKKVESAPEKKASSSEEESSSSSSSSSDSSSEAESEDEKKQKKEQSSKKKKKNKKKLRKEKLKQKKKEKKTEDLSKEEKIRASLKKQKEEDEEAARLLKMDERKRPYNSMFDVKKPTDEDMEAYYMKRKRDDDPMAFFN